MVRFFISIDGILFNFISTLYDLLIAISRTSILTQGDIAQFAARIEILLGIFMLFKLSFSLITYIVNPDDFSDKSKGFGKLIQNSVISLVLLVTTPYIFQMAFNLQAKILDDNTLAKLLLGEKLMSDESDTENSLTILDSAGDSMAFYIMLPFFTPRTSINGLDTCINLYENGSFNNDCYSALVSVANSGDNSDKNVLDNVADTVTGNDSNEDSAANQYITNYKYGIENESVGLTFRANTALITTKDGDDELFIIDYKYLLSTATAVIVCLLLITFCIDIGLRSVKLAFLQLIYPIPVISYMDPSSGKDGMFSKWYKMCLSTFLSLFIRLLALYFGIYIITKVGSMGMYDIINGSQITNGWVKIFVIIGILMFVKQMPKILENMGIKIDGDGKFNLNPLKKVFDENNGALGAKRVASAAGGFAVGAMHGRALRGLASGAMSGKGFGEAAKHQADYVNKLREARLNGSTFGGRMGARLSKYAGFGGASARLAKQDKDYEKRIQNYDDAIKTHENSIAQDRDSIKRNESFMSNVDAMKEKMSSALSSNKFASAPEGSDLRRIHDEYKAKKTATSLAQAKLNNMDRSQYDSQEAYDAAMERANNEFLAAKESEEKFLKKDAVEGIYNYAAGNNGRTGNVDVDNLFRTMQVSAREAGVNQDISTMERLGNVVDDISTHTTDTKNRISGVERQIEGLQRDKSRVEQERFDTRDRKTSVDANKNVV